MKTCDIPQFIYRIVSETIWPSLQWKINTNLCALYRMLSFPPMTLDDLHIHHCNIGLVNAVLTQVVSSFVCLFVQYKCPNNAVFTLAVCFTVLHCSVFEIVAVLNCVPNCSFSAGSKLMGRYGLVRS